MKNKQVINTILKLLGEETKKIKKKKKSPLVATPMLRRPMGSIFSMDAAVSMAESELMSEASRSIIKPITKKFDHLKWKLNDFQKQFLDDFINIPESVIKQDDLIYASKRTGIPVENIKSIRNTYGSPEFGYAKPDVVEGSIFDALHKGPTAKEMGIGDKPLSKEITGKLFPLNQNPNFRNMTPGETIYKAEFGKTGGLHKKYERELPDFMYEWLMYFLEGTEKIKLRESKLMNDFYSDKFGKYKFVMLSFDIQIKESGAHPYDIGSNTKVKDIQELEIKLKEFNETFGVNFVVGNQYTGNDGFLKVVLENAQLTDGKRFYNREFLDMTNTEEKRMIEFLLQKSIYE